MPINDPTTGAPRGAGGTPGWCFTSTIPPLPETAHKTKCRPVASLCGQTSRYRKLWCRSALCASIRSLGLPLSSALSCTGLRLQNPREAREAVSQPHLENRPNMRARLTCHIYIQPSRTTLGCWVGFVSSYHAGLSMSYIGAFRCDGYEVQKQAASGAMTGDHLPSNMYAGHALLPSAYLV